MSGKCGIAFEHEMLVTYKGNELSAKRLIAKGWTMPDDDSTAEYARVRWSIPA